MGRITTAVFVGVIASASFGQEDPAEAFPHISVDVVQRVVEIEGVVPWDFHDPETPHGYLEVVACGPGTKEHEALVMSRARASHIHAALLSIGLEPGSPGRWTYDGETLTTHPPEGPEVKVEVVYTNDEGERVERDVREWIVDVETGAMFDETWVFAGSRIVRYQDREFYDADGTGLLVGLTTFGSEVVACKKVISHRADVDEPTWIANRDLVPAVKTPVTLRLSAVVEEAEPVSDAPAVP